MKYHATARRASLRRPLIGAKESAISTLQKACMRDGIAQKVAVATRAVGRSTARVVARSVLISTVALAR
jgi:hypothetical protein